MTNYNYEFRELAHPASVIIEPVFRGNDTVEFYVNAGDGLYLDPFPSLRFQSGPIPEHGVNGLTNEILIDVLVERIGRLNKMFPCRENALAITKLEEAGHWLNARTARREKAGLEGKHEEQAND
ncbi:MAG: hypothetical protein WC869_13420 [Phycisphaerae bacterium]|jgi:hypothetical protein